MGGKGTEGKGREGKGMKHVRGPKERRPKQNKSIDFSVGNDPKKRSSVTCFISRGTQLGVN